MALEQERVFVEGGEGNPLRLMNTAELHLSVETN